MDSGRAGEGAVSPVGDRARAFGRPEDGPGGAPARRHRILFVAEAVTLAHVARPFALMQRLDPGRFEACLAFDPRFEPLLGHHPFPTRPIHSIPSAQFRDALARGRPVYDAETLRAYVREDLEVLREVAPDAVVGDFRLSLAVSARAARVPYLAITNAYWSPHAVRPFPVPELPMTRHLGVPLASVLFRAARPIAFACHTLPLNRVRREYGLPSLGHDLLRIYTEGDHTLYADAPELVPTVDRPDSHHDLGPILWSPRVPPPDWWDDVPEDRPIVYVTLGSSGRAELLPTILEALSGLPVRVLAATLGAPIASASVPGNAWLAAYLPGEAAAARARLVVCNGGSPTAQQALAAGVPVLGIPSNLDQHMNMELVRRRGAGELVRSERARAATIRVAVETLLDEPSYTRRAAELAAVFASYDPARRLDQILTSCLS